jgi:integrase
MSPVGKVHPTESLLRYDRLMKGSIRERSKGVYELRVYTGRDPVTKRPRQISKTFKGGKRDANTELARMVAEASQGKHGGTNATVEVLLDAWLKDAKSRVSEASYAVYEDTADRIKTTDLALVRLNRVSAFDVDACYSALRNSGTTPHTMVQVHRYLRAALNKAVRWGWLRSNPTSQVDAPKGPTVDVPSISVAEVHALIEEAEKTDKDLAAMILLAALTGLRRGELCGLRWSDVEGRTLVLRRSRVIARGQVVEKGLKMRKTGETDRVQLDDLALAALDRLREGQRLRAARLGAPLPEDGWLLSKDGMGHNPRRPDAFGRDISAAGKAAGMKTSPHKLRHFMATELLGSGADIGTVAERLRHRDKALTLRTYTHGSEALGIAAADTMGRLLAPRGEA